MPARGIHSPGDGNQTPEQPSDQPTEQTPAEEPTGGQPADEIEPAEDKPTVYYGDSGEVPPSADKPYEKTQYEPFQW